MESLRDILSAVPAYEPIREAFLKYHQDPTNVLLHLFTTTLGIVGLMWVLRFALKKPSSYPGLFLVAAHTALLTITLPSSSLLALTVGVELWCVAFAAAVDVNIIAGVVAVALGYFGQDFAHWVAGEATYQSATWGAQGLTWGEAVPMFFEHTHYLVPLVLDSVSSSDAALFVASLWLAFVVFGNFRIDGSGSGTPFTFQSKRMLKGRLDRPAEKADMATVRAWAMTQNPPRDMTSHWWVADLGAEAKAAFHRLETCQSVRELFETRFPPAEGVAGKSRFFGSSAFAVKVVPGMNELYVSGPNRAGTSDNVFFTEHIDGPYGLFPFASVYRCIVGLDENTEIKTIFPMAHDALTAQTGDILAFDFNREAHLIDSDTSRPNKQHRVVLKLHYVTYPAALPFLGEVLAWLTTRYNEAFRALFLSTIKPSSTIGKAFARVGVVGSTKVYNAIGAQYVGFANAMYVSALALAWYISGCYGIFLAGTQFVHYCRYISTYYIRKQVDYGVFKRDVLFYKSLALCQLAFHALSPLLFREAHITELVAAHWSALVAVAAGYAVSVAATAALGIDGTYFGIELGFVKADYKFVQSFPYNVIPHPMILGQVVALAGLHSLPSVGGRFPLLCPTHIALYLTHMFQEIYDFHDGTPWYKNLKQD